MLSKIKTRCRIRGAPPQLAICITMYNEDEDELQTTVKGLLQNYNSMKMDAKHAFTKDDFLVCVICDGYDRIPESLKKLAREKRFLDEEVLFQRGFMEVDKRTKKWQMKNMKDIMDEDVPADAVP